MSTHALAPNQARVQLHELTVIDVRTPGEYASGHLPGAHNIPLDHLDEATPALKETADGGDLLVVCASGARSARATERLAEEGIAAATLTGGTGAWVADGHALQHPDHAARPVWGMERQVRLTAGALVLIGLGLGLVLPAFQLVSAGIAAGLVFSALTNTCGMAAVLAKLPHNRPRKTDLAATLDALRNG